jgi:putative NADH-flavin reductase
MQALLASTHPKFNITVLARPSSSYEAPSEHVKVVKHELTDQAGIAESLRGIDAVILVQGVDQDFVTVSKAVIEAAITAEVKMVMPSDYGR